MKTPPDTNMSTQPVAPMALPKNIESKIMPVTETGCWLWLGCLSDGYGMTTYKGKGIIYLTTQQRR